MLISECTWIQGWLTEASHHILKPFGGQDSLSERRSVYQIEVMIHLKTACGVVEMTIERTFDPPLSSPLAQAHWILEMSS